MKADILPVVSPGGIISLGDNSHYTRDETGLIHLQRDVLLAAVNREVHFLLHPEEEQLIATRVYTRLRDAFALSRPMHTNLSSIHHLLHFPSPVYYL